MQMPWQLESTKMSPMCSRVEGLSGKSYEDIMRMFVEQMLGSLHLSSGLYEDGEGQCNHSGEVVLRTQMFVQPWCQRCYLCV